MSESGPETASIDLFDDSKVSILIVGDSGTHKTYFAGGAPSPFFIDTDANLAVLRPRIEAGEIGVARFKEARPGMDKIANPARGIYKWGEGWPAIEKKINQVGEMIDKGTCPYRTLVPDSLTTLANIALNHVIKNTAPGQSRAAASSANPNGIIDPGQWGQQMRLLEALFDQLTGWPINLICTAHINRDQNTATTGGVEMLPLVTGKLAGKIALYFNEVWYTRVEGTGQARKWTLVTETTGEYKQAKTTNGVPMGTATEWSAVSKFFQEAVR